MLDHPDLDRFAEAFDAGGWSHGTTLPPHTPTCFGCGPDNPAGAGLRATVAPGDAVEATYTFPVRFEGGPGVVHGGAVATVMDDLFGQVLLRILVPAVTRTLTVDYQRPVHLGEPCQLHAALTGRDGRRLTMHGRLEQDGEVKVTADAVFVEIEPERLANRYAPLGP
jgi:acyl-coenzyme A thioesterase PaaI-like protein